ncbi:MAG: AbrB/MazE/SpoVT family DNA-binding domain-containing protein [Candidatus Bathyarchaeia archaeon]|jgi:AbrB family looped-hinge helix DNA binding protein
MEEEFEIAIVGSKGQIVIPQRLRKELAITPNTKLCVYRKDDKLVVVKLKVPPLADLKELLKEIDEQNKGKKKPTEEEVLEESQACRREKKAKQGT